MEALKKQRGVIKGKVTRCTTFMDACAGNPATPHELITRLEALDIAWNKFQDVQMKIIDLTPEAQLGPEEQEFAEIKEKCFTVKSALREMIPPRNPQPEHAVIPQYAERPTLRADLKLPRMDLPTFDGNQLQWQSFSDLFRSIVHNNAKISNSQKLHYLKNSLLSEAKSLLESLDITDANYTVAWDLLTERYQNERQIILCHLNKLLNQRTVSSESSSQLRNLLDSTAKHIRALTALNLPTQHWDHLVTFILIDKLDTESRKQWELHSPGKTFPTLQSVRTFLEQRCRALEATTPSKSDRTSNSAAHRALAAVKGVHTSSTSEPSVNVDHSYVSDNQRKSTTKRTCPICKAEHAVFQCPDFQKMDVKERGDQVRKFHLCFNCFNNNHAVMDCKSKSNCRHCNKRHNSLLHKFTTTAEAPALQTVASVDSSQRWEEILLSTALVRVKDHSGKYQECRVLLDNGSQANLVSKRFAQILGHQRSKSSIEITGIGGSESKHRGILTLTVESRVSNFKINVQAIILTKLTSIMPTTPINTEGWEFLQNLTLADPSFSKPGDIDMIIGAEYYEEIVMNNSIASTNGQPHARNSHFGWILSGKVESRVNTVRVHVSTMQVSDQLKMFWELEEMQNQKHLTVEEKQCEEFFQTTHSRDSSGRFTTSLPFRCQPNKLGSSKQICMKILQGIERKLERNPVHRELYNDFMTNYLSLGHMDKIPPSQQQENPGKTNYLPHHFVYKDDSKATNIRVVFDASMRTSTGTSLNDVLMVGDTVQDDLHTIITRFRIPKYVFTAYIVKMYRQIKVPRKDADF